MTRTGSLAAALVIAAAALLTGAAPAGDWRTYANARFDYSICYPAKLLIPQDEAANGDGRVFTGSDGAMLRIYGSNNALDQTLQQAFGDAQARETKDGGVIAYKASKQGKPSGPAWYVLSGRQGDSLFYIRTNWSDNQFKTFDLRYPAAAAARWNPVAARMSGCFKG